MNPVYRRPFVALAGVSLLAAVVGLILSPAWGWGLLAGVAIFAWLRHLRNLARLELWSRDPFPDDRMEGDGWWEVVFGRLYRHERELRRSITRTEADVARFAAAGQALTDGVILLDPENRITWCNTTACRQLGMVLKTDLGQPLVNLLRQPVFLHYLAAGDFSRPLNLRSEQMPDHLLSIHIIDYGENSRLIQIKDVTQAERIDRMRRDFVANVSHELRTPLTVLHGFLETVREIDFPPEQRQGYLDLMAEQSERMQRIVQDLLTLSSLEAAPPPPENERIDVATLVDKVWRDAKALSGGRHVVELHLESESELRGAESEMASAFGNLVTNAVRYTPAGGRITLSWRGLPNGGAEFAVEDTGVGIDPAHIARLTERFYRADRGRSRDTGGTGLGLAIVKHALSRHQATLDVQSQPGKGSRFAARFPASRVV